MPRNVENPLNPRNLPITLDYGSPSLELGKIQTDEIEALILKKHSQREFPRRVVEALSIALPGALASYALDSWLFAREAHVLNLCVSIAIFIACFAMALSETIQNLFYGWIRLGDKIADNIIMSPTKWFGKRPTAKAVYKSVYSAYDLTANIAGRFMMVGFAALGFGLTVILVCVVWFASTAIPLTMPHYDNVKLGVEIIGYGITALSALNPIRAIFEAFRFNTKTPGKDQLARAKIATAKELEDSGVLED